MDFIICQVGRFTGNIDGIFNRNILQNIQIPQFTANMFCGKAWGHHLFVKGEGDVGTVVLVVGIRVAFGPHRLLVGGPAFPHGSTRVGEAVVILHRDTGVASRALAGAFAVQDTRPRATPNLRTGDFSIQTLTGIAVVIPLSPIWHYPNTGNARPSCNFLASWTTATRGANATVPVNFIYTGGSKGTGRGLAFVDIDPAVRPGEAWSTLTAVPVLSIHTSATVVTRMRTAVVCVLGTCGSFPALLADTSERVPADYTGTTVVTGVWQAAAVPRYVTSGSFPSRRTHALESVPLVIARPPVVARRLITLAVTGVASFSFPPIFTFTEEVVDQVSASSSIVARVFTAVINIRFTICSFPSIATNTFVGVDAINASATIFTGVALTVIDILMTVGASESFVAFTGEFSTRLALALPVRTTDIGRDVANPLGCAVGSHCHGATVNYFARSRAAVILQVGAVLPFVILRAVTEIVHGKIEALGTILAWIWLTVIYVQLTEVS